MLFDELGDALRVLPRHQASGKFRVGFGRDDGLCAFALITAPDPVEFERRASPQLFDGGESFFAAVARSADGFFKMFAVPGQTVKSFAFGFGKVFLRGRKSPAR